MGSERAPGTNEIDRKMWQKARAGVTARTRGGGRASRAKLIGWAWRSVTTSCGSPPSVCRLNSLMEPINKDGVCARSRVQPEEAAKQAATGRTKPAVISKLSAIPHCSFQSKQTRAFISTSQMLLSSAALLTIHNFFASSLVVYNVNVL